MTGFLEIAGAVLSVLGMVLIVALCVAGLLLSCLSISGTWLVAAAAVLAALIRSDPFPGIWTIVIFLLISALVEVAEAVAGAWGVRNRGGSRVAGLAAVVGGLLGLALGSVIPVPLVGGLVGMLVGSFALVFAVERHRLQQLGRAANIAWGAVVARLLVVLVKVTATLGMAAYLLLGMIFS